MGGGGGGGELDFTKQFLMQMNTILITFTYPGTEMATRLVGRESGLSYKNLITQCLNCLATIPFLIACLSYERYNLIKFPILSEVMLGSPQPGRLL